MAERGETLTYKQNMSRQESLRVMKAIGFPIGVLGLGMFTISNLANFGTKLVCPMSAAMLGIGVIVGFLMPAQRREVLMQTLWVMTLYFGALLGLKFLLGMVSGVSSEMIAASYDQAIPTSTGNAIPGYLQNFMWFTSVLTPLADITMQAKRLKDFKHNQSLTRTFGQKRSIRNSGKDNFRMTK